MFKKIKQIEKQALRHFKLVLAVVILASTLAVLLPSQPASAAYLYETEQNGKCNDGDLKLDKPLKRSANEFYCVASIEEGDTTPADSKGNCDKNIPKITVFGATLCLSKPSKYRYEQVCPAGGTEGNCNIVNAEAQKCIDEGKELCDIFDKYINPAIQFLGAVVGMVVIIMVIVGGIQYSSSGGDPQKAAQAKKRIANAIFALLAYALLYAFLQWVMPGGIL